MKFFEIIKAYSWTSLQSTFLDLYPEEETYISSFEEVFNHLKIRNPKINATTILIRFIVEDDDDEGHFDVVGYENPFYTNEENLLAIEFLPWDVWLGMDIDAGSLNSFHEKEIIAHCLYEMTFNGFDEEKIQQKKRDIESMLGFEALGSIGNPLSMREFMELYPLDTLLNN